MKIKSFFVVVLLSFALLVACKSEPAAPVPTETEPEVIAEVEVEETETPVEPAPVEVEEEVDACVDCHTDKDQLIDTADAVEEVESENSGEG